MPETELARYRVNLSLAREMVGTGAALENQLTSALDVSDLYRGALVQAVSAFDYFIHDEVRARILTLIQEPPDRWPNALLRLQVPLSVVVASSNRGHDWLEDEIRRQHAFLSFQNPDKVARVMRLAVRKKLWPAVASALREDEAHVRRQLKVIVDRRNQIAHSADYNPTPPVSRYPISKETVLDAIEFLERLGIAIAALE